MNCCWLVVLTNLNPHTNSPIQGISHCVTKQSQFIVSDSDDSLWYPGGNPVLLFAMSDPKPFVNQLLAPDLKHRGSHR